MRLAKWVSGYQLDDHVADVIYTMLDYNGDGRINPADVAPILYEWRHGRGFIKDSLHLIPGHFIVSKYHQ